MRFTALLLLLAIGVHATAGEPRSASALLAFKRANPCPSTGERRGACPGHVIDHVVPLCAGGEDHPRNMQWQTITAAKRKDVEERRQCRAMKRQKTL